MRAASRLKPLEEDVGTRANIAKEDGRRMNEFGDKSAEQMWQDYTRGWDIYLLIIFRILKKLLYKQIAKLSFCQESRYYYQCPVIPSDCLALI